MPLDTSEQTTIETEADARPPLWSGHIFVPARDLAASSRFYEAIGMRPVFVSEEIAVLELRGGTHLIIRPTIEAAGGPAGFDLMVEDIAATHESWRAAGLSVSRLEHARIHDSFTVTDPSGNTIVVNNSHVIGVV